MADQLGPYRPHEQHEGPASSCVYHGQLLGWKNCSCTGMAMGIDQATLGAKRPDDCAVREATGDWIGGTTLPQVAAAAEADWGVHVELHVGANVAKPAYVAGQLRRGRGVEAQGNAGALLKTAFRSTAGYVNHEVHVNEGKGWRLVSGVWLPSHVLVFDPAADTRKVSWGTAANAPDWWPWATFLAFCAALQPRGDGTAALGPGAIYSGILPLPRVALRYTGSVKRSAPHWLAVHPPVAGRRINVRSGPSTKYPVKATLGLGDAFVAYQRNTAGQNLDGSRVWEGSQDGSLWAHASGLR